MTTVAKEKNSDKRPCLLSAKNEDGCIMPLLNYFILTTVTRLSVFLVFLSELGYAAKSDRCDVSQMV